MNPYCPKCGRQLQGSGQTWCPDPNCVSNWPSAAIKEVRRLRADRDEGMDLLKEWLLGDDVYDATRTYLLPRDGIARDCCNCGGSNDSTAIVENQE